MRAFFNVLSFFEKEEETEANLTGIIPRKVPRSNPSLELLDYYESLASIWIPTILFFAIMSPRMPVYWSLDQATAGTNPGNSNKVVPAVVVFGNYT